MEAPATPPSRAGTPPLLTAPRPCSIARALEIVGERWSLLVIREVTLGVRRFDAIQAATGAPRAVLTDRLANLVRAGVLDRVSYREDGTRARPEYRLTQAGRELSPVLTALRQWGDRHLSDEAGPPATFTHVGCGAPVRVQHVCAAGHLIDDPREVVRTTREPSATENPADGTPADETPRTETPTDLRPASPAT
ncbi:helix-turn-helix transcriptional regulator [Frankia sp. AgB1.9]|uniref:winged helix-turn-helix transcriptional regulator n=1 Tax=unclassified Frankia TaxID=2632575 RepID=UPI0019328709|nr:MULTISPECIES: helix-turn-helix domain-containing protein [unclassified Frankia]MBL7491377.1 helix-turn-helix transcriptional regulator [Frankia sp. AgW1.1]MBL7547042.1 helix-turn-helix transcriptional regulator [Frankia sp. AgB1.9]MBL7621634.1 helix-turn-helix transcriptional regulator [Frankia sp. AgB1.8]